MTKAVSDLVQAAAPLDEEKVRAFMRAEAAKYNPNWWWKFSNWANRHPYLLLMCFLAVMGVKFFISDKSFGLDAMTDAFFVGLILVGGPFWTASHFEKGPAEWYVPQPGAVRLCLDDERMAHLRVQYPDVSFEVETLQRTTHRRSLSFATVVWLVLPNPDGSPLRRGMSAWSASPA